MLNKVLLIGNLTRDVEIRYTQGGTAIGKFGLAVNRKWKDRNSSEDREETMFIDINCFGRSAEIAHQFLAKGRQVLVEGRLVLEQWNDQNGQKKSKHSISADNIQFLGGGRDRGGEGGSGGGYDGGYDGGGDYSSSAPRSNGGSYGGASANNSGGGSYGGSQNSVGAARQTPPQNVEIDDEEIPF